MPFLLALLLLMVAAPQCVLCSVPSFGIDGDSFVKDGVPFIIRSGELHFWRALPDDWEDRLGAVAAMGFNTITVYANWALHEPQMGEWDFEGPNDIAAFVALAWNKFGLHCVLRVGPCIVAETENGGFPYWLSLVPGMQLRSMNATYLHYVDLYFAQLLAQVRTLQYNQYGGPIILVQVEDDTTTKAIPVHEDQAYRAHLVQSLRNNGITALANTLCFPLLGECERAHVPGAILAAEFPYAVPPSIAFDVIRLFYPKGPLIVLEVYSGWECCCLEGRSCTILSGSTFAKAIKNILDTRNASLSVYMAFGGTNFGFSNGALHPWDVGPIPVTRWGADITSYDYDAPIHEAGQIGEKYQLMREVLAPLNPRTPPVPQPPPIAAYGAVTFTEGAPLFGASFSQKASLYPLGMEQLGQAYGYILYQARLTQKHRATEKLSISGVMQDRALVYMGGKLACILGWSEKGSPTSCEVSTASAQVSILVENKGRVNEEITDFRWMRKGIYGNVTVGDELLSHWQITSLPLTSDQLSDLVWAPLSSNLTNVPYFYRGYLNITANSVAQTFLLTPNWGHGVVFVNGFNLGRFSMLGPQCSLYVPRSVLRPGQNTFIVFESDQPIKVSNPRLMISTTKQLWFDSHGQCTVQNLR